MAGPYDRNNFKESKRGIKINSLAENVALHKSGSSTVVVKTLVIHANSGIMSDTVRELSIGLTLNHPNIVKILDILESDWKIELSMKDVGISITKHEGKLAEGFMGQLLSAVKYIHSLGFIHRDIKPENVLVRDGRVTLIDFGFSRKSTNAKYSGNPNSLAYQAPEVLVSNFYNHKVDIWSVGVIWVEMLLGVNPFLPKGEVTVNNVLVRIVDKAQKLKIPGYVKQMVTFNPEGRPDAYQILKNISLPGPRGYNLYCNSCYLDSLLMILYFSDNYWKDRIANYLPSKYNGKILSDIKGGSKINTLDKFKDHLEKLKSQFLRDSEILTQKNITSLELRELLAEILPEIRPGGVWTTYVSSSIYGKLGDLFPINMDIPTQVIKFQAGKYHPEKVSWTKEPMITFWDFMDTLENVGKGENYKIIRWDLIKTPILTFCNGLNGSIKKFNSLEPENGIKKARVFGETILDRYRLIGVVTLYGPYDAGHYVSWIKIGDDWWFYDDVSGNPVKRSLPVSGIWEENGGATPAIYFYKNVNERIGMLEIGNMDVIMDIPEELNPLIKERCKCVKKMYEFCNINAFTFHTWFLGVKLLDLFITNYSGEFMDRSILVSMVMLSLSSKFLEVRIKSPRRYSEFSGKIFSEFQFREYELRIFKLFGYNVNFTTSYDYFISMDGDSDDLETLIFLVTTDLVYKYSDIVLASWAIEGIPDELLHMIN